MPHFIGVSGIARKVNPPHVGVSGVARKISDGYVGVNEIARKFFPDVFTWNKYSVKTKVKYTCEKVIERGCNGDSQCPPNYASSHTWCTTQRTDAAISTGRFAKTGTITLPANYKNKDPGSAVGYTFMASSYVYDSDNESFTPTFMDSGSTSDYAVHVAGENYGVLYKVVKGSGPQTQGSYLGRVTSENENAYPDNGIHTDGYWYVKL